MFYIYILFLIVRSRERYVIGTKIGNNSEKARRRAVLQPRYRSTEVRSTQPHRHTYEIIIYSIIFYISKNFIPKKIV